MMMLTPLTEKQIKVVLYIHEYFSQHKYPPLYSEMNSALENTSTQGHINGAVKKGWLKKLKNKGIRNVVLTDEAVAQIDTLKRSA